ncbi:MAG: DUF3570 domain-containing protein [Sandaracinaceae bacterium]
MRLQLMRGLALLAALLVLPGTALADESSGTWTGNLQLRANYYWETSTRVVAPEVNAQLESPEGVTIQANYLIDTITSASLAAGVQEDIRFTEVRNQGSLGLSRELDLGGAQLRLGTNGRISHEPDYLATGITAFGQLALNQRSTILGATLTYIHDDVGAVVRGGGPRVDDTGRDLSDRGRQGQLEGVAAGVTVNQVLSPVCTVVLGYSYLHNWGFLQNAYRRAAVASGLTPELHPSERNRHTLNGRLAYFVPETQTAFHLMYRAYIDDWNIGAISPEFRIYQMIGPSALVRLRYRYYDQTDSYFYEPMYDGTEQYVTADQKMQAFHSHMFGAQLRVGLDFLSRTPLSFLSRAWLDMSFNYWVQTSGYGNGVLSQVGFQTPF